MVQTNNIEEQLSQFLAQSNIKPDETIALAVSGGRDSYAMAHAFCKIHPNIHILTVDHGFRQESKFEAIDVAKWAKEHNITCDIITLDLSSIKTAKMQIARDERYKAMSGLCNQLSIKYLATAHHCDDQIETFLQRIIKASGLKGLAGIKPISKQFNITLLRPLLKVSRQEVTQYCIDNKLDYVDDPSNKSDNYQRSRIRKIVNTLKDEGLEFDNFAKSIHRLEQADSTIDYFIKQWINTHIKTHEYGCFYVDYNDFNLLPLYAKSRIVNYISNLYKPHSHATTSNLEEAIVKLQKTEKTSINCMILEKHNNFLFFSKDTRKIETRIINCEEFFFDNRINIKLVQGKPILSCHISSLAHALKKSKSNSPKLSNCAPKSAHMALPCIYSDNGKIFIIPHLSIFNVPDELKHVNIDVKNFIHTKII